MGIISLPDKTTRNLPCYASPKQQLSILVSTFSSFSFPSFSFQVSLSQVSSAAQGTARSCIYLIYLFPLSRILRSLSQSIRTILHSTRQTLESISYCFGTSRIYSTFYISIDLFCILFLFIFLGGCYRR